MRAQDVSIAPGHELCRAGRLLERHNRKWRRPSNKMYASLLRPITRPSTVCCFPEVPLTRRWKTTLCWGSEHPSSILCLSRPHPVPFTANGEASPTLSKNPGNLLLEICSSFRVWAGAWLFVYGLLKWERHDSCLSTKLQVSFRVGIPHRPSPLPRNQCKSRVSIADCVSGSSSIDPRRAWSPARSEGTRHENRPGAIRPRRRSDRGSASKQ